MNPPIRTSPGQRPPVTDKQPTNPDMKHIGLLVFPDFNILDLSGPLAAFALAGNHDEAARVFGDALASSDSGCAGWVVALDPLLQPTAHRDAWTQTLAMPARPCRVNPFSEFQISYPEQDPLAATGSPRP